MDNVKVLSNKNKIGITGVTGKLGAYTAEIISEKGIEAVHIARTPERAKAYENAEIRRATYTNTPETVDALKGIETLLMVSAHEGTNRVNEHKDFLDAAKSAGVKHIVYISFYGADEHAVFTLSRDHAKTEDYIQALGFDYTFLRDNFYQEFFIEISLEYGELRGPAGNGKVSTLARKDVSEVAAKILQEPEKWKNQILNMTGPEELSIEKIVKIIGTVAGRELKYVDETVEEAYESRKKWKAEQWEYDAWVSTYTAIAVGEQSGVSDDIERVLGRKATALKDNI